jgi:putative DNA primase/helicase
MLGDMSIAVTGGATTEAAIRQLLNQDAIPIVQDEAEGTTKTSVESIQKTLELARGASTNDGGQIAKGSSGGTAKMYSIQSCFAFASINPPIERKSDKGRVSVLSLIEPIDKALRDSRWLALQDYYEQHITEDFAFRLQARTMKILTTILTNTVTFSTAAAEVLGAQRQGDQYGVLLAGAYSLTSDAEISYEDAKKWIETKDWTEEIALSSQKDELNLFNHIMGQGIEVVTGSHGRQPRNIAELVLTSAGLRTDTIITPAEADATLRRHGIRVEDGDIYISNGQTGGRAWINKIMEGTDWVKGHAEALKRITGAKVHAGKSFAGITMRSTSVPLDVLTGSKVEVAEEPLPF